MSIEEIVRELSESAEQLSAKKLSELSTLSDESSKLFEQAWPEINLQRRLHVIEALIDLAEDNVEMNFDAVYVIALKDRDPEVRRQAIRGLWENERRQTFDGLLRILAEDSAAVVRAEAALALGRFVLQAELGTLKSAEAERVENALHGVIEDEAEEIEVRGRALESIGAHSVGWVSDIIHQAFDSGERRMRISAVHAMGRNCNTVWLPMLYPELENEDAEMRFESASAIGMIAEEESIPYLLPILQDEDAEVRAVAIAALGEIGGDAAKEALEELLAEGEPALRELVLAALADADFAEDPLSFSAREEDSDAENAEA